MDGKRYKVYLLKDAEKEVVTYEYSWWMKQPDGHRFDYDIFHPKLANLHKVAEEICPEKHFVLISTAVRNAETSRNLLIRLRWINDKKNDKVRATLELKFEKGFVEALLAEGMRDPRICINGSFNIGYGWRPEYGSTEYKLDIADIIPQENAVLEGFEGAYALEKAIQGNTNTYTCFKIKYNVLLTWFDASASMK